MVPARPPIPLPPRSLRDRLAAGPLALPEFFPLAMALSGALATRHDDAGLHGSLSPGRIGAGPVLTLASPDDPGPGASEDPLPYMAPEQTGRTGLALDHRADLYALGAIFYELLVGVPPFVAADPVELVHAHLARLPQPPSERDAAVPPPLSDLVLKLLAKDPDARYQTARGLERDLRDLAATGGLDPFELGRFDRAAILRLPDKLYGRAEALEALRTALQREESAGRELVLVAGEPGIGKSALVREALPASRHGLGAIAAAKFDQLQRGVPYADLARAFRQHLKGLLAAPEPALDGWRARLREAIDPHGAVVAEVVPELAGLLGPQPPVEPLEPREARHRFHLAFAGFASALGTPGLPLVLFLDDLQWADPASLALVQTLVTETEPGCLRIVGAYRDAEVDAAHPLALALSDIERAGVRVRTLPLGPLSLADVTELCREALAASPDEARPLAVLLQRFTGGNPFFLRQLLRSFLETGLLRFDLAEGSWRWDLGAVERLSPDADVVGLMIQAIGRLPAESRQLLTVAACLGNRIALGLLAAAAGRSPTTAARELGPAVEAGLLQLLPDQHYQFAHDQVQLAAGSLLPAEERLRLHLQIGRLLRSEREGGGEPLLFDAVDHLNRGASLIADPTERLATAGLNLEAGEKARASAAYAAALGYAEAGMALLPPDAWEAHAPLAYGLHRLGAESAYLSGDPALAERLVERALAHAPSLIALADLYNLRIVAAATAGEHARALALGREGLALFGVVLAPADLQAATAAEMAAVRRHLGRRRVEDLLDAPEVADEGVRACLQLLSNLYSPAYMTDQGLYALIAAMMVHMSVRHGRTVYTAESYVIYGLVLLRAAPENAARAFAFANTGVAMARAYDGPAVICKVIHVFATILNHWQAPLRTSIPLDREAFRAGLECGQFQFAGFATFSIVFNLFDLGTPLEEVLQASEEGLAFGRKIANKLVMDIQTAYRQAIRCLLGLTAGPTRFEDAAFDEDRFLEEAQGAQLAVGLYEILRLRVAYLLGDQRMARRYAEASGRRLGYVPGVFSRAEQVFYQALNLAALLAGAEDAERAAWLDELAACEAQLAQWAVHAPGNFQHKAALVAAERARLAGSDLAAMRLYDQAIEGAEEAGYQQDTAIASELAGRFFLARDQARLGRIHLQAALAAYHRWGARTKVAALVTEFPGLSVAAPAGADGPEDATARLDALSLLKAAQALSEEIVLDRLLEKMLAIVLEAGGATRGVLIIDEAGTLVVRARTGPDAPGLVGLERVPVSRCAEVPQSLIRYVARARETVVSGRGRHEPLLASEPLALQGLRSVLCMPILKQGRLVGLLYLENGLLDDAFGPERVEVLQLLSTQMAISLENALLYTGMRQAEEEVRQVNMHLEARIRDRTLALEAANRELEAFSYSVSHDLRAPLRAINGFSRLVLDRHAGGLDAQGAAYLQHVHEGSERMEQLIADLLELSRLTRGAMQRSAIDLGALASEIVAECRRREPGRRVTFTAAEGVTAHGDPPLLRVVLENLLGNAWKYTSRQAEARIAFGVTDVEGSRTYYVQDDGVGFDMAYADKLFKPFQRLHPADAFEGTGVGLATVQRVIRRHGGRVWAEGAVGAGATFYFQLGEEAP